MSPLPTTGRDLRAVVRAADALTTQVRRIADALETPVVEYEVAEADAPTTTGDGARIAQWIPEPPGAAEHRARVAEWITRGTRDLSIPEQAPAADEDALRATRRESARIILDRATRGIALRSDESALLRQHFDAETREHCGHLSPETLLTTPRTECVLRPGHTGSHADDVGCRWWPINEEETPGA